MPRVYAAGTRCGEVMGLEWEDFSGDKLHIRRSVTRRGYSDHNVVATSNTKNSIRDHPIIDLTIPYIDFFAE